MNTNRTVLCVHSAFIFIPVRWRSLYDDTERISERYQRLACELLCNATAGDVLAARLRGEGEGRAGATTRLRSVTTPLFIATQPNPPTEPVQTSYGHR